MPAASATGYAHIRFPCFTRTVHHTAHDRNLQRGFHMSQGFFNFSRKADNVHLGPGTGRT